MAPVPVDVSIISKCAPTFSASPPSPTSSHPKHDVISGPSAANPGGNSASIGVVSKRPRMQPSKVNVRAVASTTVFVR